MLETKSTTHNFPTVFIDLPSQGKCYPSSNPLSSGKIEIKYMTAREEEILASQNYIKKGVVLDKLFESIIVDKTINIDDIIVGDKNAIMLATRILGYGPEYEIEVVNDSGSKEKYIVDLSKVQTKDIDYTLLNGENEYDFITPVGKNHIKFKILTHGDEKAIDADIRAINKANKNASSAELTTRYRYLIKSVDGSTDTGDIVNFINNKFLARDTKAFRERIKEITPDIDMYYDFVDEDGETERRRIPMTINFFWPTE